MGEAEMLRAAEKHEALALQLVGHFDTHSTTTAAAHFAVAAALRARAGRDR